jgi:hypothetical protein
MAMTDKDELKRAVCEAIDRHGNEIIELGETILHHPETGFNEVKTAALVAERMRALCLEPQTGLAMTGIKGRLKHDCLAASLGTMYLISEGRQRGATRLHGSCFINELCREISYVRDPCFVSRRTFSLADAQISHRCLGTEERCAAISHGSRCCPHDRAPAAFWTGEH